MTTESLAAQVVRLLAAEGRTLATAESLTGGLIGAELTAVPGASAAFLGGVIVYATALKHELAGVPQQLLDEVGPVSERTALALAAGVRRRTGADWGLAATGVAGPDPQDGHAPGEVWLGLAGPTSGPQARRLELRGDRAHIRGATVTAGLEWLAEMLRDGRT